MAKIKLFTAQENRVLTEVYRRFNKFHKRNVDANLIMLAYPSKVKTLISKKVLTPSSKEISKVLNWYNLGTLGKDIMMQTHKMKDTSNLPIFEGKKVIDFNIYIKN